MPTPKNTRGTPARNLDDYVFTRAVSHDLRLSDVSANIMTHVSGTVGASISSAAFVAPIEIGFDFQINGTTYKHFAISTAGFIVLIDPTLPPSAIKRVDLLYVGVIDNERIKRPFDENHTLLAPWFDELQNTANNPVDIYGATSATTKVNYGIKYDVDIVGYDQLRYGVKYHSGYSSDGQKRLVVRWHSYSYSTWTGASGSEYCILTFEAVLYENGTFEFRYAPLVPRGQGINLSSAATCGIFLSESTLSRDFAGACGYLEGSKVRAEALVGAYRYDPDYVDTVYGTDYSAGLRADIHWPAGPVGSNKFAIFKMSPPLHVRRELPRNVLKTMDASNSYPTIARTGDIRRSGSDKRSLFDDQRSISFSSGTLITAGPGLPVLFAQGSKYAGSYSDLYLSGGLIFTASVAPSTVEQYVFVKDNKRLAPFDDHNRPEQGMLSTPFFSTGSNIVEFGDSLLAPLQSKTQIKLSLPITKNTTMLEYSSSLYYYNRSTRSWFMPQRTNGKDVASAIASIGQYFPEDARGFGPLGNVVASGSFDFVGRSTSGQTAREWGPYVYSNPGTRSAAYGTFFAKSIQNNSEYTPQDEETFSLPISQPFLLEKAVIEIPISAGPGWFNDRTTCGFPIASQSFSRYTYDFAGPALTISLFNNRGAPNLTAQNDLILTGTVIPLGDTFRHVKCVKLSPTASMFSPQGFTAFGGTPSVVVKPNSSNTFTGSISVAATAAISNGIMSLVVPSSITAEWQKSFFSSPVIDLNDPHVANNRIYSVNPFGRGGSGFDPSGRSTFGKEYGTFETTVIDNTVNNPLFISASYNDFPTNIKDVIDDVSVTTVMISTIVPLEAAYPSPYLLMPGDRLYLGISKMRPMLYSEGVDVDGSIVDRFTGSLRHDVNLPTGSINITLYGSLLREGHEYHNGLNQELTSDAIHEALGSEPVVDQYDVEYRGLFAGTMIDDYVTGSLINQVIVDSKKQLVTGSRGRVFSKFNARLQATPEVKFPGTASYEVTTNPSKAFRLQPWYEKVGNHQHSQVVAYNERFWDSMIPNLQECLGADDTELGGVGGVAAVVDNPVWPLPASIAYPTTKGEFASILFDVPPSAGVALGTNKLFNDTWTRSYPFEPRYSSIARQPDIDKATSFTCNSVYSNFTALAPTPIAPTRVKLFVPGFLGNFPGMMPSGFYSKETRVGWSFASDVRLDTYVSATYITNNFEAITPPAMPGAESLPLTWDTDGDTLPWISISSGSAHGGSVCLSSQPTAAGSTWVWFNYTSPCVFKVTNWQKIDSNAVDTIRFQYQNLTTLEWTPLNVTTLGNSGWEYKETGWIEPGSYRFYWFFDRIGAAENGTRALLDDVVIYNYHYATSSMSQEDLTKVMYGFGDMNTVIWTSLSDYNTPIDHNTYGTNHLAEFRNIHADVRPAYTLGGTPDSNWMFAPVIRGWKYGLRSGLPEYSKVIFRQKSYGQFRDMLEQRPYTKYFQPFAEGTISANSVLDGPVFVKFVDQNGDVTPPERTWSSNVSFECTSSVPYVDGESRNRGVIDVMNLNLNSSIISFT